MAYDPTISGRWSIDYTSKRIYRVSGKYSNSDEPQEAAATRLFPLGWNSVDSVVDLYSWLQDSFDEAASMDDKVPMSAQTPNAFTMINGWFIDDDSVKFLNDGAIQSNDWTSNVWVCDYAGGTEFAHIALPFPTDGGDIDKEIITASYSGTILHVDSGRIPKRVFIRPYNSSQLFDTQEAFTVTGGTGAATLEPADKGETLYTNIFTLGTIADPWGRVHIYQSGMNIGDSGDVFTWGGGQQWWPSGHIDILVKVKEADGVIDGGSITPFLRQYSDLYDNFPIDLSAGGRQAAPLATGDDLNNDPTGTYSEAAVSGFGNKDYSVADREDITIAFVNSLSNHGGVTGTFTPFEGVSWTGGKGIVIENVGDAQLFVANLQGTYPTAELMTGKRSAATVTPTQDHRAAVKVQNFDQQITNPAYNVIIECSGRTVAEVYEYCKYVTAVGRQQPVGYRLFGPAVGPWEDPIREVGEEYLAANANYVPFKASPFGTFAGGTFFGARGVWLQNMDAADIQAFSLVDTSGTTQTPPNQVSITVNNTTNLDQVFVARSGTIDGVEKDSFVVNNLASPAGSVVVSTAIPADTPSTGFIRIYVGVSGTEDRYAYTSWTGSTFTLAGTTSQDYADATATAYVPFIDEAASGGSKSVTVIFNASDTLIARVRRYQGTGDSIIPYEGYATLGTGGFSATATRQDDTIVQ